MTRDPTARAIRHVIWLWALGEWKEQLGDVRERRKRRHADKAIAARAKARGKRD
jgi:hypothetical protein